MAPKQRLKPILLIESTSDADASTNSPDPLGAFLSEMKKKLESFRSSPLTEEVNVVPARWEITKSNMKDFLDQEFLKFLNTASEEELKKVKGIGEKTAAKILELREGSPEPPFKSLDDLEYVGLKAIQVKGMMKKMAIDLCT